MNHTQVAAARGPDAAHAPAAPAQGGRLVSIDILRGLAILWVILFHLWADMTHHLDRGDLFVAVREQMYDGKPWLALRTAGEVLLSQGNLGVALFMMLSGLSLTLNAYRRDEPPIWHGYVTRFRRVVPVYWAGFFLFLATIAAIALIQTLLDGHSYGYQWSHVTVAAEAPVRVGWADAMWALSIFAWVFRDKPDVTNGVLTLPAPVNSLWFVQLLLAYYLLFPFALRLERRIGPWNFALVGVALAVGARAAFVPWSHDGLDPLYAVRYLWALFPFRLSEFFLGMSLGHLLATRHDDVGAWLRRGVDTAGFVALGVALVVTGLLLAAKGDVQLIASDVVVHAGLALVIMPLLFKAPGRLETSVVARALVSLGVVSFTALIVNDMMRYVASFLRTEHVSGPAWWFFLVVVYVPGGTLLAYPLASAFGLLPSQRARDRAREAQPAAEEPRRLRRRERRRLAREARAKSAARA